MVQIEERDEIFQISPTTTSRTTIWLSNYMINWFGFELIFRFIFVNFIQFVVTI